MMEKCRVVKANYVSLCRLGGYMGYLKDDEVLNNLHGAAVIAQNNYASFQEFGLASTVGTLFSGGHNEYYTYLNQLNKALTHPKSFWKHIEWHLDLSQ